MHITAFGLKVVALAAVLLTAGCCVFGSDDIEDDDDLYIWSPHDEGNGGNM